MENAELNEQTMIIDEATYVIKRHFGEREIRDLVKDLIIKEARKNRRAGYN